MNNPLDPWQGGRHTELVSELRLDGGRGSDENLQNSLDLQPTGRMQFIIDCVMKFLFSKSRMVSNDKSFDRVQKFIEQWFANGTHPGNTTTTSKIQGNPYYIIQIDCFF
jgi:hypothetical protein